MSVVGVYISVYHNMSSEKKPKSPEHEARIKAEREKRDMLVDGYLRKNPRSTLEASKIKLDRAKKHFDEDSKAFFDALGEQQKKTSVNNYLTFRKGFLSFLNSFHELEKEITVPSALLNRYKIFNAGKRTFFVPLGDVEYPKRKVLKWYRILEKNALKTCMSGFNEIEHENLTVLYNAYTSTKEGLFCEHVIFERMQKEAKRAEKKQQHEREMEAKQAEKKAKQVEKKAKQSAKKGG